MRVLQWNILADSLSGADPNLGGFTHEGANRDSLGWERRRGLILEIISRENPDLICLEEVDHPEMMDNLKEWRYVFHQVAGKSHGILLAWRHSRFRPYKIKWVLLPPTQLLGIVYLEDRERNFGIQLMGSHLKADKDGESELIRAKQMEKIIEFVTGERQTFLGLDMNSCPHETDWAPPLCYETALKRFRSACLDTLGAEPVTTCKLRKTPVRHCIDYVLYTKGGFLPTRCKVEDRGMVPNFDYPSDHYHVVVDFEYQ